MAEETTTTQTDPKLTEQQQITIPRQARRSREGENNG